MRKGNLDFDVEALTKRAGDHRDLLGLQPGKIIWVLEERGQQQVKSPLARDQEP
jgi:hypothetical protein